MKRVAFALFVLLVVVLQLGRVDGSAEAQTPRDLEPSWVASISGGSGTGGAFVRNKFLWQGDVTGYNRIGIRVRITYHGQSLVQSPHEAWAIHHRWECDQSGIKGDYIVRMPGAMIDFHTRDYDGISSENHFTVKPWLGADGSKDTRCAFNVWVDGDPDGSFRVEHPIVEGTPRMAVPAPATPTPALTPPPGPADGWCDEEGGWTPCEEATPPPSGADEDENSDGDGWCKLDEEDADPWYECDDSDVPSGPSTCAGSTSGAPVEIYASRVLSGIVLTGSQTKDCYIRVHPGSTPASGFQVRVESLSWSDSNWCLWDVADADGTPQYHVVGGTPCQFLGNPAGTFPGQYGPGSPVVASDTTVYRIRANNDPGNATFAFRVKVVDSGGTEITGPNGEPEPPGDPTQPPWPSQPPAGDSITDLQEFCNANPSKAVCRDGNPFQEFCNANPSAAACEEENAMFEWCTGAGAETALCNPQDTDMSTEGGGGDGSDGTPSGGGTGSSGVEDCETATAIETKVGYAAYTPIDDKLDLGTRLAGKSPTDGVGEIAGWLGDMVWTLPDRVGNGIKWGWNQGVNAVVPGDCFGSIIGRHHETLTGNVPFVYVDEAATAVASLTGSPIGASTATCTELPIAGTTVDFCLDLADATDWMPSWVRPVLAGFVFVGFAVWVVRRIGGGEEPSGGPAGSA